MLQWSWCDIRSQTFEGRPKKQQHRKSHRHFVLCRQEGHLSFNDRVVPVNRKEEGKEVPSDRRNLHVASFIDTIYGLPKRLAWLFNCQIEATSYRWSKN